MCSSIASRGIQTAPAYGRFWIDIPGKAASARLLRLVFAEHPSVAKQKLREHIESSGVNNTQTFIASNTAAGVTLSGSQANTWIEALSNGSESPVKPATIRSWRSRLEQVAIAEPWGYAACGCRNAAMKALVDKMPTAGLSAKSIVNYCQVVKLVVASAVNAEGEQASS